MTALITVPELSLWAEGNAAAIDPADPLALWLINSASTLVQEEVALLGGKAAADWTADTAPGRAKIIVANIAKRCWNNADQETRTSIAGGPSSAVLDEAALGMRLSDAEIAECGKVAEAMAIALGEAPDGFWTLAVRRGPLETPIAYFADDRWPESSPIGYLQPARDPEYFPTSDPALPTLDPATQPTNTVL